MNRSLENCIPKWAVKRVCRKQCNCGYNYKQKDIIQIGIRKIRRDDRQKEALAIETTCPICKKGTVTTFAQHDKDFRQLLCSLLDEMQKIDRMEKSQELEKEFFGKLSSRISDNEVEDFKKDLSKTKSYDDFLKLLGIKIDDN